MNIRREIMQLIEDRTSSIDALAVGKQLTEDARTIAAGGELVDSQGRVYAPEFYDRVRNMTVDQLLQPTPHLGVFQVMGIRREFGYDGDEGLGYLADDDTLVALATRIVEVSASRAPRVSDPAALAS